MADETEEHSDVEDEESEPEAEENAEQHIEDSEEIEETDSEEVGEPEGLPVTVAEVKPYKPHPIAPPKKYKHAPMSEKRRTSIQKNIDFARANADAIASMDSTWKARIRKKMAVLEERSEVDTRSKAAAPEPTTPAEAVAELPPKEKDRAETKSTNPLTPKRKVKRAREADDSWGWLLGLGALATVLLIPIGLLLARPTRKG